MMRILTLFLLVSTTLVLSEDIIQSLRWQKVRLEDQLQKKIAQSLTTVLDPKDFVVSVELELKEVKPLKFKNKVKKPIQPEEPVPEVRLSDIKFDDSKGDYIAFSKVGLEVPVLDKLFKKEEPKKKNEDVNLIELEQKKWEFQDYVRRMRDLFLYIKDVRINIFVNEKLPEEIKLTVSNLLKSLEMNIAGIEPLYNIKQIKMDVELPPKDPPKLFEGYTPNDYVNLASKFSTLIGTLLAAFLIGIFLFLSTRSFIKFKEREKAKLNLSGALQSDANNKDESKNEGENQGGGLPQGPLSPEEVQAGQLGLDRFITYLNKNSIESLILIKKWLQMAKDDEKYVHILTAIGQQVDFEQFQSLLGQLSEDERYNWGQMVGTLLGPEQLVRANAILNEELIGQIIVPSEVKSSELIDILLNIEKKDAIRLIADSPDMGALYLRMVNPNVASKVFAKIEQNKIESLIEKAMTMDMQAVGKDLPKIISFFKEYQSGGKILPFANKVFEMFKDISPAREIELFKGLAKSGQVGTLKKAIDTFFPASLLLKLPSEIQIYILKDYPLNSKIELIASLDEEKKDNLMAVIAPPGSTLNELISIEFENLENDEAKMRKIFKQRDKIFAKFAEFARAKIKSTEEFDGEIAKIKDQFIQELGGEKARPKLSLAS